MLRRIHRRTAGGVAAGVVAANHTVVLTFNQPIGGGSAAVTSGTGNVSGSPAISGNTMTVNVAGVPDVQRITLTLNGVATSALGQTLPSTGVNMGFLIGDVNGDGTVNAADATVTRNNSGQQASAANFRSDVNVDGTINAADATTVRNASGHGLPPEAAGAPQRKLERATTNRLLALPEQ